MMKEYFLPVDYQQQLYLKYQNYTQRNCNVDKYTKQFYCMYARNNMDELEFRTVTKYLSGLKQELQDEIIDAI